MPSKRIVILIAILAILVASFGFPRNARAWSSCSSYHTVWWGDTLSGIAVAYGTTMYAVQAANPGLGSWVYAGQVLCIPAAYTPVYAPSAGGNYVVQRGDSLGAIARRMGVSLNNILALNPQITNASLIYAGQVISLPATPVYYTVCRGDTLRIIASRYGTSVYSLQLLNPQITNANLIYVGQTIRIW